MDDTCARSPGGPANGDRLNGWKDIAGYLGKSVRTAQRWEQELRLPVRRIHTATGEIVYASRREVDEWLEKVGDQRPGEDTPPADNGHDAIGTAPNGAQPSAVPARSRLWMAAAIGLIIIVAAGLAIYLSSGVQPQPRGTEDGAVVAGPLGQPASWKAQGNRLIVFDERDQKLWEYRFDFPLKERAYGPLGDDGRATVLVADLDGDGGREVLVRTVPSLVAIPESHSAEQSRLYCFNSDGTKRFEHQPEEPVRFGSEVYGPPFGVNRIFTTDNDDRTKTLWIIAQHRQMFPTVLQKIDTTGRVEAEFWSNGHVSVLTETRIGNRRVIALGGTNNERWGGSLALLDYERPGGSTPANPGEFRCTSCAAGQPFAYFVFPQLDTARAGGQDRPFVWEVRVEPDGAMRVTVTQGSKIVHDPDQPALAFYTLGPDLRIRSAEVGDDFWRVHAELQKSGLLDHPFGPADEAALFPILSWDGHRFVTIAGPQTPQSGGAF